MKFGYFTPLAVSLLVVAAMAVIGFAGPGIMSFQDDAASQMMAKCPMHIEGTTVQAAEVANGVALAFTTTKGDVEELRSRVQLMASMHNGGQGMMTMHSTDGSGGMMQHMSSMNSMHGKNNVPAEKSEQSQQKGCMGTMHSQKGSTEQQMSGMGMLHSRMGSMMSDQNSSHMMMLPDAEIAYETVTDGARLIFTPENKTESAALLDQLTRYADMMNSGTCTQLQMMNGMMSQPSDGQSDTGTQQETGHAGHHE